MKYSKPINVIICFIIIIPYIFTTTIAYSVQEDLTKYRYVNEDGVVIFREGFEDELIREGKDREYHQFPSNMQIGDFIIFSDFLPASETYDHYQSFLTELISDSANTNSVANWSDAKSIVNQGKVWGSFISARSELEQGEDSQLIGLEIDVLNNGLAGESPNQSKVGLQIVGFGNLNTNAIEVLTDEQGLWQNVINIAKGTVDENGTVLGVAQETPIKIGIDFSNTPFSDAAIALSNESPITLETKNGNPASIYTDTFRDGYLVIQTGKSGIRLVNNQNNENLLVINGDGTVDPECLLYKNYLNNKASNFSNINVILLYITLVILIPMCIWIKLLFNKIKKLQMLIENK